MSRIPEVEFFVEVIARQSFTDAAEALGVSKSHVSKQVSQLEDRLGVRLLNRTTRKLGLTDAGEAFYDRARRILEELDAAERDIMQLNTVPRGVLRLSAPMSFGVQYLSPILTDFVAEHTELELDLHLTDRTVGLIDEGFDLVVRIGSLADSSFMARKLAPARLVMVASPDYLAHHGEPQSGQELHEHQCLHYTYQASGSTWRLDAPGGSTVSIAVRGRVKANSGNVLLDATRSGLGIAIMPEFLCHDALRAGEVVEVLPEWSPGQLAIWALYPHSRHLSAKVRACVDHLVEKLEPVPWKSS